VEFKGTLDFRKLKAQSKPVRMLLDAEAYFKDGGMTSSPKRMLSINSEVNLDFNPSDSPKTPFPDRETFEFGHQFEVSKL